ncbi:MAG: CvpA family protein [Dehalococcoidia bacterium]|nr:CvpA family protein [Dehalococcoidia bacterium]
MNWLTILIIIAVGFMTWRAYRNGFVRELVSLSAVVLAIPIAGIFYDDMYPKVHPIVDSRLLANLISFLAIFTGVIVGGQVAAHLLKQVVAVLNLGAADHLAGAAFGFVKGVVVCQALLIAFVVFPRPDLRDEIDASPLATGLLDSAPPVLSILPGRFDDGIDLFLAGVRELDDAVPGEETPAPEDEEG